MRLILFDIDGTLIFGHGVGHRALVRAMQDVFGTAGTHEGYDWRGKTDPLIVGDLMRQAGIPEEAIAARLPECFDRYVCYLEDSLANGHRIDVLPGIAKLLPALAACSDALVGLLTGNVERGAVAKLRPTGLLPFFRVGAYGSDDPDRRRLPVIAQGRVRTLTGRDIDFRDMTIIGDTPLDVDCARACGARAVAVATGQHSISELAACNPDDVFPSFADVEAVTRVLLDRTR
jgi:phosphoglycolate phosphatase-like HAD superfamily hydrolase